MKTALSLLAALAAMLLPATVRAATVPVTITIDSVMNISAGDAWSRPPDFYARLWIDGATYTTPMVPDSNGFASPAGWTFTRMVSRAARGGIARVRIELRDWDYPLPDPLVDIDTAPCASGGPMGCAELSIGTPPVDSYGIDLVLNLSDGSWRPANPAGDSTLGPRTPNVPQRACSTGAGSNVANLCFTITVGAPVPEVLTVSKLTDSERAFCAPSDCSLREAVTHAEGGDTISLPAASSPYLLSALGDGHLAIRQPLLTLRGPTDGGPAVIRQTRGDLRVFDVHAGAKLVMSRVTVTGGGAGDTSTAYLGHIHGGGIHNHGAIELTHVTITGNRATDRSDTVGGGGGVYNAKGATARLINVTIAGNSAATTANGIPLGGGIGGPGTYTLRNTLIVNNTIDGLATPSNCGVGGSVSVAMTLVDEGGNLQYPGSDCGRWVTFQSPRGGLPHMYYLPYIATASMDPLRPFDAMRGVFVPLAMGPAIDIGVAGCGPSDAVGPGVPRDGNGDSVAMCDAGAVEAP